MSANNSEIDPSVIRDKTATWPGKAYYFMSSYRFIVRVMHQIENHEIYLNSEVRHFINNPSMQLFRPALDIFNMSENSDDGPYKDLKEPVDTE